jgi:hypothetical protein
LPATLGLDGYPSSGQLLALVDALHAGTLNDAQRETAQALRAGILATFASLSAGLAEGPVLSGVEGDNGSRAQAV